MTSRDERRDEKRDKIRIGCASGFWGDSSVGAPQLVRAGNIHYLVFDYLAELTMSILAGARLKNPAAGYATDFVTVAMKSVLAECLQKGIRVVSNAGGVNPRGCADALKALAAEQGLHPKIAVVEGDDVMPLLPGLREKGIVGFEGGESGGGGALPRHLISANAYLGAVPISAALDAGADVVITGRCVDSAVTLGPLIHEFGWKPTDYDLLASGSLAGHLLECGCQATGGLHTDWEAVPDWANIGYPIAEVRADGVFTVTKAPGTGGLVTPATVGEQLLYEIGDPSTYILPDVICDFRSVQLVQVGPNDVKVTGAQGRRPTNTYKVSATYVDGFRCSGQLTIIGFDAARKAQRTGEALLERTRSLLKERTWEDFSDTRIEVLGSESIYGPLAEPSSVREVVMRIAVAHPRKEALELFRAELAAPGTSWSPGTTGGGSGRPSVSPAIKQFAFLLDKNCIESRLTIDSSIIKIEQPILSGDARALDERLPEAVSTLNDKNGDGCDGEEVSLILLAYGRSGDKGDISNIGIMARQPEYLPCIAAQVTAQRVSEYLAHLVKGKVTRYSLPGIGAFNFVCEKALGGGGIASLRNDPLGKGMAQILLSLPVRVPKDLVRQ
ncbi:MAG TPA: acyclic terpene utilization AtuA family protein [Candidatus Angelobacter sp.]|nr:acyclic terpene utilization AtuA family protein [Candidatus Angelobacter sp.]